MTGMGQRDEQFLQLFNLRVGCAFGGECAVEMWGFEGGGYAWLEIEVEGRDGTWGEVDEGTRIAW